MSSRFLATTAIAAAFAVSSANAATEVNIAFIMDESGSVESDNYVAAMQSLSTAIGSIPRNDPNVTYTIGVISFSTAARTVVAPTVLTDATIGGIQSNITGDTFNDGTTCYSCAFSEVVSDWGTLDTGDISIINMMTDGEPTAGDTTAAGLLADVTGLRDTNNWDALSFEAVENFGSAPDSTFLANLAFDTGGFGGSIINTPAAITDPLNDAFVLEVTGFGTAYDAAINSKIQRIVDPDPVPLPAGLPLLIAGLGAFGVIARSKKKKA